MRRADRAILDRRPEEYAHLFASASGEEALAVPGWSSAEWGDLLALTEPHAVRSGEIVIERGERDHNLYFVAAGSLELRTGSPEEMSLGPLVKLGAGSVVGEIAFFDRQGRSASVWAASDGVLLRLSEGAFDRFGEAHPERARDLLYGLGRVLATRLRRATSRPAR